MEDIEYLEEYEDLVLPALNSAAAEAAVSSASFKANENQLNQKNNEADDSSSSLDQDIFNCLFDDNSDDEDYNDYHKIDGESALRPRTASHETFVSLQDKFQKIGNTVIEKVEISRQDPPKKLNVAPKIVVNKITSPTKPKSLMTKTSGTTVSLSALKQQISANKTKSIATVRPTVQNQLTTLLKKTTILQRQAPSSSTSSSSSSSSAIKRQNPSTSAASKTYRTIRFPVVPPPKPSSTSTPISAKNLIKKRNAASASVIGATSIVLKNNPKQRPATIVRPEKIISKDPANDPLDLDDISETDSDNSSFSDISGETYNTTISDFEEDDTDGDEYYSGDEEFYEDEGEVGSSQIIELSNDSSGTPSKLEDIRAPTPPPVISDDSNTSCSSFGFIISKKETIKPYSHPAIIESVLIKGEKPKLLELLQTYNLLEDSVENIKDDNIVIDITTSRENLVENIDTQQQVTSSKQTLPSTSTTIIIDPVDSTVSNKSLTLNTPNIEQTSSNSKKTNKKKKKKNLSIMDAINDFSTDSDLSAVEELLEESYAEAMKRGNNVPITGQDVGAEIVIDGLEQVTEIEENEQKLPKADVVIDYDDKSKEKNKNTIENAAESLKEQKEITNIEDAPLNKESEKMETITIIAKTTNEQSKTVTENKNPDIDNEEEVQTASVVCHEDVQLLEVDKSNKVTENPDINSDAELKTISIDCLEAVEISEIDKPIIVGESANNSPDAVLKTTSSEPRESVKKSERDKDDITNHPSNRKKKRFRNLLTPEPTERSSDETKSVDDLTDFKGFDEEIKPIEKIKQIETIEKNPTPKDIIAQSAQTAKNSQIDLLPKSFKSPSKSHQSPKEKSKDAKNKNSRDSSADSREKSSSKNSSNISSSTSSKDRSSRESSRDKSSRESSKDRHRDRSRDRPKYSSHDKEHGSKYHHRDPRRSCDSKDSSSKSRESSKSRDSRDSSKHISAKNHQSLHSNKECIKSSSVTEKRPREIEKTSSAAKFSSKDYHNRRDLWEHKSSKEKSDKKSSEASQNEKEASKSSSTSIQESKQNKDMNKSTSNSSSVSRETSKDRKSTSKYQDSTKSGHEANKSEKPKNVSSSSSKTEKLQNPTKSSQENAFKNKVVNVNNSAKDLKDTTEKKLQDSANSPTVSSKTDTKRSSNTPEKISSVLIKNDITITKKTSNEKEKLGKPPNKPESSHNTKVQNPKDTAANRSSSAKPSDRSSKNSGDSQIKDTIKLPSENMQKSKTILKTDEVKSKSSSSDCKKPKESFKELDETTISNSQNRSIHSKQEEIKNTEESTKNVEALKDKNLEKPKEEKSPLLKSKGKTKYSNIVSEKSENIDKNEVKISENISDKQPCQQKVILEKNEPKKVPKKEDSTDASKSNISVTTQDTASKEETKKETASAKENRDDIEKKESMISETASSSKAPTTRAEKTPQKKQEVKEQKSTTTTSNNLAKNSGGQTASKVASESSATNKDKLKENTTEKKLEPKATALSAKTLKKTQSAISKMKTEAIKTVPKIQNTSAELKTVVIANSEEVKKGTQEHDTTASLVIAKKEDGIPKDATENLTENLVKEATPSRTNVENSSASKTETLINAKKIEIQDENSASKEKSTEDYSSKTERLMKAVLKKSVVVLIEPLKPMHHYLVKSNEDYTETEPRRSRNRKEDVKQTDSIDKEDHAKENSCENIEARKPKRTSESGSSDDNKNKSEEMSTEEQMKEKDIKQEVVENSEVQAVEIVENTKIDEVTVTEIKQKSDLKTEISDNKETLDDKAKEEVDLEKKEQTSGNQKTEATNVKAGDKLLETENIEGLQDQHSETNKITEATNILQTNENKSEPENNKIASEENNFKAIKTREKTATKTAVNKSETGSKEKSERLDRSTTPIDIQQNSDSKTESEIKGSSGDNVTCEKRSSEKIQTGKNADLKSESLNTIKTKENSDADIKTEIQNLESKAELKTEGASQEAFVENPVTDENSADGTRTRTNADLKKGKNDFNAPTTRQKRDVNTEVKKSDLAKDQKTTDIKADKGHNIEQTKKADIKMEANKSEKANEPIKIKTDWKLESKKFKADNGEAFNQTEPSSVVKKELTKSKTGDKETSKEKTENKELSFESIKTRKKSGLTTQAIKSKVEEPDKKLGCEDLKKEICDVENEPEKSSFEPIKTRQKSDIKTETKESEAGDTKVKPAKISEYEGNKVERLKTRQNSDLNVETKKCDITTANISTEAEKSSEDKQAAEIEKEKFEPIRTRARIGQKHELEMGKNKVSNVENSVRNDSKDSRKSLRKTLKCDDDKYVNQTDIKSEEKRIEQKECEISSVQSMKEMKPAEPVKEPIKTRRRGNLKEGVKSDNENTETKSVEENSGHSDLQPTKTRRGDIKLENDELKTGLSQAKISEDVKYEAEKEPVETLKLRKRGYLKENTVNENQEVEDSQKESKDDASDPMKTSLHKDSKVEGVEENNEMIQSKKSAEEKEHLQTPSKTIKTGNVKEARKEKTEKSERTAIRTTRGEVKPEDGKYPPIDEKCVDSTVIESAVKKSESKNDNNEIFNSEPCKEENTVQEEAEEQHFTPRKTRSQVELEIESATDINITEKNVEPTILKKDSKQMSKETLKADEKLLEPIKTRRAGIETKQKETTQSAEKKPYTSQKDKVISTADEKQVPTNESKQEVDTEESISLRIISEIDKICHENSENEMSGFESSSSSTDNINRRTLRKRGTDSPLLENENAKKQFKEPAQKITTLKSNKTEKAISNVSGASSKRFLRSPALEQETQSLSKKPKLDLTKKSTRFRNLHDDGIEEELKIAPTKSNIKTKGQSQVLEKIKLNQSITIVRKSAQNENTKEVKDNAKNTVLPHKKVEEKVKQIKNPQTSMSILPEDTLDKESTKQSKRSEPSISKANDVDEAESTPVLSKTSKTKLKAMQSKSPGSGSGSTSVLSFSDWLKTKSKNAPSESVTSNDDTPDNSMRQSRARVKITPNSKTDLEKPIDVSQAAPKETTSTLQGTEKASASQSENTVRLEPEVSAANETMTVTQQLENNLLQSSENLSQSDSNGDEKSIKSNKKANVKRLQTSFSKSKNRTATTPTRHKRNEIDLLIESMSKEMKDGGITDLLNTDIHVKRQRLPNSKNLSLSPTTASTPARETRTLTAAFTQLPNIQHSNDMPKFSNVSENLELKNKSPTRRRVQQNLGKSRKDSSNTPNITALTGPVASPDDPKTRKSLNIKDISRHTEIVTKPSAAIDVNKTRKSVPLMPSEFSSFAKNANSSTGKQQSHVSKSNAFKLSKPTGLSILLPKLPTPNIENIKKLCANDKNLPDSRKKIHQTEQDLLKKFKCRKLAIRLDRTIAQNYLNSTSNSGQQSVPGKQRSARPAAGVSKIIRNNSETNLRIQSVLDATSLFNTSSSLTETTNTQAAQSANLRNSRAAPVPISAQPFILPDTSCSVASLAVPILNESFEFKNEFMDENPIGSINEAILPDTPTLLARAQTVTEAAHQALSNSATPTDIRLLTTDSTENNFVPSFGVTPTALDNRGTCMYTFLHPAKYNRNHSNVLLDYCCPNLDGPMPAIDPTRIHAQVQAPVVELPASIVLTTKVVRRTDLESGDTSIPAIIRKKAEKIRKNMATHHKMAVNTLPSTMAPSPIVAPTPRDDLPPIINALSKQLPSTTTITPRMRPPLTQQSPTMVNKSSLPPPASKASKSAVPKLPNTAIISVFPKGSVTQLNAVQQSSLRSNLRRFDVLLKQLVQPYESLNFVERHNVIEAVISSGKCLPKDLEQTLVLMEEYIKQTLLLKNGLRTESTAPPVPVIISTNNYTAPPQAVVANVLPPAQMPQLQPSPQILASKTTPVTDTSYSSQFEPSVRKVQSSGKNIAGEISTATIIKHRQVPIYDTDRNIIGYQMQNITTMPTIPANTKSSSYTGTIISTAPNNNSTAYKVNNRPLKRPAQDSPRVFYTTPPSKTSTPKPPITNTNIYPTQQSKTASTIPQKTQSAIVTAVRTAASPSSANTETITTTTMATVKRVTRSTATGSKIIIVSKSNQSSEESILPDANCNQDDTGQTQVKQEDDIIEDILG